MIGNKVLIGLALTLASFVFIYSASVAVVHAAIDKYAPGDTIVIGDFVYDDNYVATTSPCTVTMYDPTNTLLLSAAPMTALATGWHYYSTTTLFALGLYPTTMTCGSVPGGDLANLNKNFLIGYTGASTTDIAAAVDVNTQNDISAASNSLSANITSNVNTNTNATVLAASTSLAASLPSLIWNYTGRTLTSFGTLASDVATAVWSAGTRSLTTFGTLATDVWSATTRTLSGAALDSGGSLAVQSDVTNASSSLAANINANVNGQISSAVSTINANTNATVLTASPGLLWLKSWICAVVTAGRGVTSAPSRLISCRRARWILTVKGCSTRCACISIIAASAPIGMQLRRCLMPG